MLLPWVLFAVDAASADSHGGAAATAPSGEIAPAVALDAPHAVRSGLVVGLTVGGGLGAASGYPNDSNQIGVARFYSASAWMLGTSETLFVMGALTDYLNVGFFFSQASFRNADWRSSGGSGGLRVEAFPFAVVYPPLSGLGVVAQFGLGTAKLTSTTPGLPQAEGTQSFGGVGVLYEWAFWHVLGGHFAAGPSLEFDATWSQPFERHGLISGARLAFYGGP